VGKKIKSKYSSSSSYSMHAAYIFA